MIIDADFSNAVNDDITFLNENKKVTINGRLEKFGLSWHIEKFNDIDCYRVDVTSTCLRFGNVSVSRNYGSNKLRTNWAPSLKDRKSYFSTSFELKEGKYIFFSFEDTTTIVGDVKHILDYLKVLIFESF